MTRTRREILDYYDQAGIGDAEDGPDDDGPFDPDERFNVRTGRAALADRDFND
jgi:hypothetical protein